MTDAERAAYTDPVGHAIQNIGDGFLDLAKAVDRLDEQSPSDRETALTLYRTIGSLIGDLIKIHNAAARKKEPR